jgi:hypothetical protein
MTRKELVQALFTTPTPRPDAIVYPGARKLFPTWLMILVGLTVMPVSSAALAMLSNLVVLIVGVAIVGKPEPPWLSTLTTIVGLLAAAAGVYLNLRWILRRRASFIELMRIGALLPVSDVEFGALGAVMGSRAGRAVVGLALSGAATSAVASYFGPPIVMVEIGDQLIAARSRADGPGPSGRASHMLAHPCVRYVALVDEGGWIAPQRVLRRRTAS